MCLRWIAGTKGMRDAGGPLELYRVREVQCCAKIPQTLGPCQVETCLEPGLGGFAVLAGAPPLYDPVARLRAATRQSPSGLTGAI